MKPTTPPMSLPAGRVDFKRSQTGKQNIIVRRIDDALKTETRDKRDQEKVAAAHDKKAKAIDRDATRCPAELPLLTTSKTQE